MTEYNFAVETIRSALESGDVIFAGCMLLGLCTADKLRDTE